VPQQGFNFEETQLDMSPHFGIKQEFAVVGLFIHKLPEKASFPDLSERKQKKEFHFHNVRRVEMGELGMQQQQQQQEELMK
jgi:hypothetical protein